MRLPSLKIWQNKKLWPPTDWQMRLANLATCHRRPPHAHICARVSAAHLSARLRPRATGAAARLLFPVASWPERPMTNRNGCGAAVQSVPEPSISAAAS
jgi:hypothetical protein